MAPHTGDKSSNANDTMVNGARHSVLPAHLDAPLPTHPKFKHDPHLPEHVARRLHLMVAPILEEDRPLDGVTAIPGEVGVGFDIVEGETAPKQSAVDPVDFRYFMLVGKSRLSHDTNRYRFGLPNRTDVLGLPIGQHVQIMAFIDGRRVLRSYTPTTLDHEKGYFDLVVKTYPDGTLSRHLNSLAIGDKVKVRGPKGSFSYSRDLASQMLLIAGGSGITPMYQIIKSAVLDEKDRTALYLIYANETEDDILLRNELEFLASKSNGRLKIDYVLHHAPNNWTGATGFVTKAMIESHIPPARPDGSHDGKVLLCGPPAMIAAMKKHLTALGYQVPRGAAFATPDDQVFLF